MTLPFYMDHHVPSAITAGLRRRGIDVITAAEDGRARVHDDQLLERATGLGRVLFSQDRDLLVLAHTWLESARDFSGLVYAHQLNISIGQAVRDLELIAVALTPEEMRNNITFIPF